jgi:DNA polymerase I-like protein with 3'-5' exonuclease and polymerase domains
VHDEVQLSVIPQEVDRVKELLVNAAPIAGQYYKFRVPITAAADSGPNWAATH